MLASAVIPSDLPASALAPDVDKPLDAAKDLAPSATSKLRMCVVGWVAP